MQRAVLAVLATTTIATLTTVASAEPARPVIWKNRVIQRVEGSTSRLTSVSNVLYLNDCKNGSCTVSPGGESSRTNRSSIPFQTVTLNPYGHGDQHWNSLVSCVRETFLPFDVEIVTEDPGNVPHFEVMIGGNSRQLHPELEAGGVAPFLGCGATEPDVISFVFPETTSDLEFLCGAVAQEACHVWGLDHEMNADDPMTYLDLGTLKRFQDDDAVCGEFDPRACDCGGQTQNSYQYMMDTFGPRVLEPASLAITAPVEGAYVKGAFPIRAVLDSQVSGESAFVSIDGTQTSSTDREPFVFNAPTTLAAGPHTITVSATDKVERTVTASVNVNVLAACTPGATSCPEGTHCLTGYCLPGADVAGGLGATCATNEECISGTCASDGTNSLCTGACDAGTCPSGYDCLDDGGAGVCWPSAESGGCSSTSGGSPLPFALAGLGLALVLARRRRV